MTRIAFMGAGNISGRYATSVRSHSELSLVGVFDVDVAKADAFADENSCASFASLDDLSAASPDIVVNLTSAPYHFETTKELISRGLNVFSEKPLALTPSEAQTLVELASASQVTVACAPSLWLGRSFQEVARRVRSDEFGSIGLITAEVNQGRIESWHPAPRSFYEVGPIVDAGVYPLTFLTAVFGPISEVTAMSRTALPARTDVAGEGFQVAVSDTWMVSARFSSGPLLRLTSTFYVDAETVPREVVIHGDRGSIRLDNWIFPDAAIASAAFAAPFELEEADESIPLDWSLGVLDMADAMREGRMPRASIEHAAHIVDVLDAIAQSDRSGRMTTVTSSFPDPFGHGEPTKAGGA